jgi:hypothetical protein
MATLVYDGAIAHSYAASEATAVIDYRVRHELGLVDGQHYSDFYQDALPAVPILRLLQQRKIVQVLETGPPESLVVLEVAPEPSAKIDVADWGFRICLDPKRGFMPVEMEQIAYRKSDNAPFVQTRKRVTEWKDLGNGVHAPLKGITTTFWSGNREDGHEVASEAILTVDPRNSTWNVEIPEETFELRLPAGTKVIDFLRRGNLVVGEPDAGKNMQELATVTRGFVPMPPLQSPAEPVRTWTWIVVIILASLAVVVMGYMLIVHRRRARLG